MRIAGLPPAMQQELFAALPKAREAFRLAAGEAQASPVAPAAHAPAGQPTTSVQMLVALAAAEPTTERRRKAAAAADKGLSLLEQLHEALVAGAPAPERLQALVEWAETFEVPEDQELASLARDIELRVRVELAKHELRA